MQIYYANALRIFSIILWMSGRVRIKLYKCRDVPAITKQKGLHIHLIEISSVIQNYSKKAVSPCCHPMVGTTNCYKLCKSLQHHKRKAGNI
jgi:hypothetical protein